MAGMNLGIAGWRGMVGSVLLERMRLEGDFGMVSAELLSTSQAGTPCPEGLDLPAVKDANNLQILEKYDTIISCQGGDYTQRVLPALRNCGWNGYWIDASSAMRMDETSTIVLDPVNHAVIERALSEGRKNYVGGNCTVSLMLMGLYGLFRQGWVDWLSTMTYQAASGAGARQMRELIAQMHAIGDATAALLNDPAISALQLDRQVQRTVTSDGFPTEAIGAPLAGNLLPWIDRAVAAGQTREEWKGFAETNKILQTEVPIPVDGLCVRIGALRCHSQACTIKLKRDIPLADIQQALGAAHPWVRIVDNERDSTLRHLTPAAVSGTLDVPVGRIRKMCLGPEYLTLMTVGDQLLWGAAEPLRRTLRLIVEHATA